MTPTDRLIDALMDAVARTKGDTDLRARLAAVLREGEVLVIDRESARERIARTIPFEEFDQEWDDCNAFERAMYEQIADRVIEDLADAGGGESGWIV